MILVRCPTNTLIFGGLIAIAVLALIALFFVLRGGKTSKHVDEAIASTSAPVKVAATSAVPAVAQIASASMSAARPEAVQAATAFAGNRGFAPAYPQASALSENLLMLRLRGQLREMRSELQSLHKQSREIEQRTAILTGITAQLEQMVATQLEGEASPRPVLRPQALQNTAQIDPSDPYRLASTQREPGLAGANGQSYDPNPSQF